MDRNICILISLMFYHFKKPLFMTKIHTYNYWSSIFNAGDLINTKKYKGKSKAMISPPELIVVIPSHFPHV